MGFMREQVIERKADITARGTGASSSAQGTNVFSMLVQASEDEESKFKLDDSELVSIISTWSTYLLDLSLQNSHRLAMYLLCFSRDTVS